MNYRQSRTEACRKLFEGFHPQISGKARNAERILKVAELAAEGWFSHEIAELLGVSAKSVQKIFRYYKFPTLHNFAPPAREQRIGWKGGVKIVKNYEYAKTPNHPRASKHGSYVAVHRLVVEQHLGRYLTADEVVDHIDGNTRNNDITNLRVFANNAEHLRQTLKGRCPEWSEEGRKRISEAVALRHAREKAIRNLSGNDAQ